MDIQQTNLNFTSLWKLKLCVPRKEKEIIKQAILENPSLNEASNMRDIWVSVYKRLDGSYRLKYDAINSNPVLSKKGRCNVIDAIYERSKTQYDIYKIPYGYKWFPMFEFMKIDAEHGKYPTGLSRLLDDLMNRKTLFSLLGKLNLTKKEQQLVNKDLL